ncbi:MAG: hypothetical protein OEV66_09900 [Spirochaetia bacterium]|nr:hypothetical protein [Spirochaetia bacterium]
MSAKRARESRKSLCFDFIYLAGGNRIKRRTICEFRRRHGEALAELLVQSVKIADKAGLIDKNKIFGLDGTKLRSSANRDQRKRCVKLEKI